LRDLIKGGGVGGGASAATTGAADAGGGAGRGVGDPEGEKEGNAAPDWESSIRAPSSGGGPSSTSVSENVEAEEGEYVGRDGSSCSGAVGMTGDDDVRDLIKGGGVGGKVPPGVGISVSWNLHLSENMEILLGYTV